MNTDSAVFRVAQDELLDPSEVRRLVPLVIAMIRDDLNPIGFKSGDALLAAEKEDPGALLNIHTFLCRWFARTCAQRANERNAAWHEVAVARGVSWQPDVGVWTADLVLQELEKAILEQWENST